MSIIDRAEAFARFAHREQRYGDGPYIGHVLRVARLVDLASLHDVDLVAAAWLHDTIEDCEGVSREVIAEEFGPRIADLVWACTGIGRNRRERNEDIRAKLRRYPSAVLVKLADRIDNVEQSWAHRDSRLFMYHREYPAFREMRSEASPLWDRLDALLGWYERKPTPTTSPTAEE